MNFSRTPSLIAILLGLSLLTTSVVQADFTEKLDEMELERYKKLREVERYQLKIAEGYYLKKDWKVAAGEYEKFITLYEESEGAPHALLRWAVCQYEQRKLNTAIREGFQSVMDYWPDSPEAVASAFLAARCYKEMGEVKTADKLYRKVISDYPKHSVAVYALVDLVDVAEINQDENAKVELWKKLTFDAARDNRQTQQHCANASRSLGIHYFNSAAFEKGVEAFETTYDQEEDLLTRVIADVQQPIRQLKANSATAQKGDLLANQAVVWLKGRIPTDIGEPAARQRAMQCWYGVIEVQTAAGQLNEIPATFAQMEKLFGVSDDLLGRLAGWYKGQNKHEEARKTYARYENTVDGLAQIAYCFREEKNYPESISTYQKLVAADMDNTVRWHDEIARTHRYAGQCDEAVGIYQKMLSLDPLQANRWLMEIGHTYRDFGKFKEAIGAFRQSESFPENYKQMAYCHRRLKEYNEARVLYNQVATGDAGSAPWALYQIAETWEEEEKKEQAILSYQTVCKKFPKDGHASRAHAHLQNVYKITVTLGGAKDE